MSSFFDLDFEPFTDLPDPRLFPFDEGVGFRGRVATLDYPVEPSPEYEDDALFLSGLQFGEVARGPSDFPIHPFICPIDTTTETLTAAEVLSGLHASGFQSQHINDLDATSIAYPGYKPMTLNDEIHTDFHQCYMFANDELPSNGAHGAVMARVTSQTMWYVLLHIDPYDEFNGIPVSEFVFLLAVGRSIGGPQLIGAISCQICHNLCD